MQKIGTVYIHVQALGSTYTRVYVDKTDRKMLTNRWRHFLEGALTTTLEGKTPSRYRLLLQQKSTRVTSIHRSITSHSCKSSFKPAVVYIYICVEI